MKVLDGPDVIVSYVVKLVLRLMDVMLIPILLIPSIDSMPLFSNSSRDGTVAWAAVLSLLAPAHNFVYALFKNTYIAVMAHVVATISGSVAN